jgi:hypothetical protein
MQTLDFTRGLERIVKELSIAELTVLLNGWLNGPNANLAEPTKDKFAHLLLESRAGYDRLVQVVETKKILVGLEFKELYDPARIRHLLVSVSGATQNHNVRLPQMFQLFETLQSLLRLQALTKKLLEDEKIGVVEANNALLELEIIDYDDNGIEPARLRIILSTLIELHMNVSRALVAANDNFTIKYFDSGSDVIMAIQGTKAVLETMGSLFLQYWDKVRFRDQDAFERDMEALTKGLEFISKVQDAVEKQALSPEEAKNLKIRVFRGVEELVGLGVTLPLSENSAVDQRQLLITKRNTKLLGSGSQIKDGDSDK